MLVNDLAKWIDELQGNISVIKQQLAALSGHASDVPDFDIDTPEDGQTLIYDSSDSKWKNAGIEPGGGGVTFYDLINEPITATGDITVEDMTGTDFLCFGVGITASGYEQIFEVYVNYTELRRSGTQHFVSGAFGTANGVYAAGAQIAVPDDTTITVVAFGKSKWTESPKIFYIRKVTIG